jgi:3',5'-nucleoside bisphosphate phosphatase
MRFDLQAHSVESDGKLAPAEVVMAAAAAGVELFALTDHDTVDGVAEARAAAREHGMRYSAASELSSVDGPNEDLHILGYEIDIANQELLDCLRDYRDDRARRIYAMVDRLEDLGFVIDRAPLHEIENAGRPIGRPHVADAILTNKANANRLASEGIADKNTLFPQYLVPGAPGYVARSRPTVAEAISLIHAAGGVAIWAHPFWDLDDPDETLETLSRFAGHGLDGVEAFYPTHSEQQTHLLHDAASARGMLITGSTDFHAPDHDRFADFCGFELYGREPNLGPIGSA